MAAATAALTPPPSVVPTVSPTAALMLANVLYEKKNGIALCDRQSGPSAQRSEYADVDGSANGPFKDARDDTSRARVILTGAGDKAFHRRRRHQRARARDRVRGRAVPAVSGRKSSISSRTSASR